MNTAITELTEIIDRLTAFRDTLAGSGSNSPSTPPPDEPPKTSTRKQAADALNSLHSRDAALSVLKACGLTTFQQDLTPEQYAQIVQEADRARS